MHISLEQHLKKFSDLNESDLSVLKKYFRTHKLKKKELLLRESSVCKDLFFVEKGCLRMYFLNKKSVEQIVQFALEGWWITDYSSFMNNTPSEYYIQAIEASEIVSVDKHKFNEMLREFPRLEKYFRIMTQKTLAASQLKTKLLYEMSKEEFYVHFNSSFPEFMQRVPQYMIASYLGLTPEYLSELRKKNL
ncbi:MAG: Crp/Fnr family transcriptional regulator [Melioribacteraceae bacterium]|nr:Crp/Fnr family transcriptional regulator [Melioribacteraceae bacterium]